MIKEKKARAMATGRILIPEPKFEAYWQGGIFDCELRGMEGHVNADGTEDTTVTVSWDQDPQWGCDTIPLHCIRLRSTCREDGDCNVINKGQRVVAYVRHSPTNLSLPEQAHYDGVVMAVARGLHEAGICNCSFYVSLFSGWKCVCTQNPSSMVRVAEPVGINQLAIPVASSVGIEPLVKAIMHGVPEEYARLYGDDYLGPWGVERLLPWNSTKAYDWSGEASFKDELQRLLLEDTLFEDLDFE